MNFALTKRKTSLQPEKTIEEVSLSLDGKKIIFLFENGQGVRVLRSLLPPDDGSPITHLEIFDHGCAVAIHQASGNHYDLPWDSVKFYAQGGKKGEFTLGSRIRLLRKKLNLSQAQLAWRTSLSRVQIARLENNRSEPTLDTIEKIAKVTGCTIAEFLH